MHVRVQCSHASVGLAQARPNNGLTIAAIVSALNRGIHCWGYVSHCLYQQVEQEGA